MATEFVYRRRPPASLWGRVADLRLVRPPIERRRLSEPDLGRIAIREADWAVLEALLHTAPDVDGRRIADIRALRHRCRTDAEAAIEKFEAIGWLEILIRASGKMVVRIGAAPEQPQHRKVGMG